MANVPDDPPIAVGNDPSAPEVFVDGAAGVFLNNGNIHITFTSRQCDYSRQPNVFTDKVVARLVMPFSGAENLAQFLTEFVDRMKRQAASPTDAQKTIQ